MTDDTHDELVKTYLEYFKANEKFEQSPSEATKRSARRELRKLITLAKARQLEIAKKYEEVLRGYRENQKWQTNRKHPYTQFMHWTYKGKKVNTIADEYEGFVYLITNKKTKQKYVGKKLAKFKTTKPPLKGKKNKRRGYKESDWREYWGSSDRLNEDVKQLGEKNFTREILYYCKSRAEMSYIEAREQFDRRVLETDEYYNGIINVRVGGSNKLRQALLEQKQAI